MNALDTATRSISAKRLKSTFNVDRLPQAISILAARLEKRRWNLEGNIFAFSGIDWDKDEAVFSRIWSAGENCAAYRFVRLTIADAMDCISGRMDGLGK